MIHSSLSSPLFVFELLRFRCWVVEGWLLRAEDDFEGGMARGVEVVGRRRVREVGRERREGVLGMEVVG